MAICFLRAIIQEDYGCLKIAGSAAVGAGIAGVGVPTAVAAAGFTTAGIGAGTAAASMMSAAAVSSGGGIVAGSAVAVLQSIGAVGLGMYTLPVLAAGAIGGIFSFLFKRIR